MINYVKDYLQSEKKLTTFECEVRFMIPDIHEFTNQLRILHATVLYSYEFTDHYYQPRITTQWDPLSQTLRLREWRKKDDENVQSEILFTKIQIFTHNGMLFKRAIYPQSKIQLVQDSFHTCQSILNDLGFEPWFRIEKRRCKLYEIPDPQFITVQEHVRNLGWSGEVEVEGSNLETAASNLKTYLSVLKINENQISYKPLARIYAEKLGIIK